MKGKPISTIALMHYWEWETELARKEREMNELKPSMNKDKQIEQERYDMAKIMADNFHINGEKWDDSDFEWTAHCLQMEGYHKQSEWISVDERLPDNHRTVLVACKGMTIAGAAPIAVGSYGGGHWFLADAEGTLYLTKYMHIVVTHWMPLPEVPKGGE